MNRVGAAILCIALAGCAGTQFEWENADKVHDGMTEGQIIALLGKPYSRAVNGRVTLLTYSYASSFGGAKAVSYRLLDGRVVGQATVGK